MAKRFILEIVLREECQVGSPSITLRRLVLLPVGVMAEYTEQKLVNTSPETDTGSVWTMKEVDVRTYEPAAIRVEADKCLTSILNYVENFHKWKATEGTE